MKIINTTAKEINPKKNNPLNKYEKNPTAGLLNKTKSPANKLLNSIKANIRLNKMVNPKPINDNTLLTNDFITYFLQRKLSCFH